MARGRPGGGHTTAAHGSLVLLQFLYGGYHVLTKRALLRGGVNMYVFCAFRDLLALACLAVVHVAVESRLLAGVSSALGAPLPPHAHTAKAASPQPAAVSQRVVLTHCAALGFFGVFANQLLFLKGLELTSPVVAAALQPAVPVFTGALAVALGSERVSFRRRDGWAKLLGSALVVTGALVTALRSAPLPLPRGFSAAALDAAVAAAKQRSLGLSCLFGSCACMAVFLTLQESLLARVGSPIRVTLLSYAFGTGMLVTGLLFGAGGGSVSHASRWALPQHARSAVIYAGVVASGLNYVLLAWGNQQLGPAMVSLYLPLQPLAAALLSRAVLGTAVSGAVVEGGALIAVGLIAVAWGRGANRRYEERQLEKQAYLARLEAAGGGENGHRVMVRSASAKLLNVNGGTLVGSVVNGHDGQRGGSMTDSELPC